MPITIDRPANKEELFNLHHAQLRNEIERFFGVLKRRFRLLLLPSEYSFDIQRTIPVAMAALHNFILYHEPVDSDSGSEGPNDAYEEAAERHSDPLDLDHCASSEAA